MDRLATHWQLLAPAPCRLALLDLHMLQPLIEHMDAQRFLATLLSPAELELFRRFSYAKRRLEWLGGRLAAKHCLHGLLRKDASVPLQCQEYSLLPDAVGRPVLEHPLTQYPGASVSISHSRRYAAALLHPSGDCGVDIQQKTPQLAAVQQRFATDNELHLFDPAAAHLTRLGLLWAAKEAVKKCLLSNHASFFGTIKLTEMHYEPKEATWMARCRLTHSAALSATVRIAEQEDYVMACAAAERHA